MVRGRESEKVGFSGEENVIKSNELKQITVRYYNEGLEMFVPLFGGGGGKSFRLAMSSSVSSYIIGRSGGKEREQVLIGWEGRY